MCSERGEKKEKVSGHGGDSEKVRASQCLSSWSVDVEREGPQTESSGALEQAGRRLIASRSLCQAWLPIKLMMSGKASRKTSIM